MWRRNFGATADLLRLFQAGAPLRDFPGSARQAEAAKARRTAEPNCFVCFIRSRRRSNGPKTVLSSRMPGRGRSSPSQRRRGTIFGSSFRRRNACRRPVEKSRKSADEPDRNAGSTAVNAAATILVVDDEPDVREVLEECFAARGYSVLGADSAGTAREMAAKHPIDVAVVDINMPGEDGLSLARHLRERYSRHCRRDADLRRNGRRPHRGPRDGRRRLRAQAFRSARAARPRPQRAAPHVARGPRRDRRPKGPHRPLRARPRRASAHRRTRRGSGDVVARVRPAQGASRSTRIDRCRASAS